jgi:hypothetical protein
LLAGTYGSHTGQETLRHRVATDTVTPSEYSQWAEGMQCTPQATERFTAQGQARPHSRLEAMRQGVQMRVEALPADAWIQSCQCFGGKLQAFAPFLEAVLPPFFQLQDYVIDLLLECFDQTMRFSESSARGQMIQRVLRMLEGMLHYGVQACQAGA